jgi:predicted RNase H-related nuclease YkuK (DUF458 family)
MTFKKFNQLISLQQVIILIEISALYFHKGARNFFKIQNKHKIKVLYSKTI